MWVFRFDRILFVILSCVSVGDLEGLRGRVGVFWGFFFFDVVLRVFRVEWLGEVFWAGEVYGF